MGHISQFGRLFGRLIGQHFGRLIGQHLWAPFTSTGPFSPFPVMLALCSGIVSSFRVIFSPCPASLVMFSLAPAIFSLFPANLSLFSCYFPLFPRYVRANFPPSPFIFSDLVPGFLVNQALCRLCLHKYPQVCLHSATMGQALWNTAWGSSKMLELKKIFAQLFHFWASIWAVHVLLRADDSNIYIYTY